jgi:hypothetical protein
MISGEALTNQNGSAEFGWTPLRRDGLSAGKIVALQIQPPRCEINVAIRDRFEIP